MSKKTITFKIDEEFRKMASEHLLNKVYYSINKDRNKEKEDASSAKIKAYAKNLLAKHYSNEEKWNEISDVLIDTSKRASNRSLNLMDLKAIAEKLKVSEKDVLATLGQLSSKQNGLFDLVLSKNTKGTTQRVAVSEFMEKLASWWKEKSISEEDWQSWTKEVNVEWLMKEKSL